jgi:hypothetical protein
MYVTQAADPVKRGLLKSINDHGGWSEKSRQYLDHDATVERELSRPKEAIAEPAFRTVYDAYLAIKEFDPHTARMGEALNLVTKMPTDKVFTGQYKGDFTAPPVNARGNDKKMSSVMRFGTSNGLHYQADDKTQVLLTAATRYAVAGKNYVMDHEGLLLAKQIADNCVEQIFDKDKIFAAWTDTANSSTYNNWLDKVKQAGYSSSHSLEAELDDRILRFQGKGNFKAKEDPISSKSAAKAPQGILAWSKGANSFFGYACRVVTDVARRSLKPNVVWNNGISVEQAARDFTKAAMGVPTDENVRLDAEEMDSKQNEFTHTIVKFIIKALLVDGDFVDLYFSMMEDYRVSNPEITMFLKWVKASGEPWTLFGNSFLMTALTLWLIRGEGPFALFTQGDDVDYNRANMVVDQDRLDNLSLYCSFVMTSEWAHFAAFCGFVLYAGQLVPNIRRKLIKLSGMNIRDVKHFQVLQIAIRDWTSSMIKHVGFADMLKVNAETYDVSVDTVAAWFDTIESLGHISEEQFLRATDRVDLNTNYLAQSSDGSYTAFASVY